jgi:hypothetical protein
MKKALRIFRKNGVKQRKDYKPQGIQGKRKIVKGTGHRGYGSGWFLSRGLKYWRMIIPLFIKTFRRV